MSKTTIDNSIDIIKRAVDHNVDDFYASLGINQTIEKEREKLTEHFRSIQDIVFDLECQIKAQNITNSHNGCCSSQMDEDRILREIEQELSNGKGYRYSR